MKDFPGIEVDKRELLTHRAEARTDGVKSVPALVYGGRTLTGFLLTPSRIRAFLEEGCRAGSDPGRET